MKRHLSKELQRLAIIETEGRLTSRQRQRLGQLAMLPDDFDAMDDRWQDRILRKTNRRCVSTAKD